MAKVAIFGYMHECLLCTFCPRLPVLSLSVRRSSCTT